MMPSLESATDNQIVPYASVIIKLLQGVLYQEEVQHWDILLHHQSEVRDYFSKIGLIVHLDEVEGYAFVRQRDDEAVNEAKIPLPRLVYRRKLTYPVTLLCVLLRESLLQFDTSGDESTRLILTGEAIHTMLRPYFKEQADETRQRQRFDRLINQVLELGFLKRLQGSEADRFEVQRILKAKISADELATIKETLGTYGETISGPNA